jgi:hypothetical protein
MREGGGTMLRQGESYTAIVHARLAETPILERLRQRDAVVLERIARGGGATNWYYCADESALAIIEMRVRPASELLFYFDDQIKKAVYSAEVKQAVHKINADIKDAPPGTRDIVFGTLAQDDVAIDMIIGISNKELDEWEAELKMPPPIVCYGEYPDHENDGFRGVIVDLPDEDGIWRPHPH